MWKSRIYLKDPPEKVDPLHIISIFLYNETRKNRGDTLCFNVTKLFLRTVGRAPRKVELYATNKILRMLGKYLDIIITKKNRRYHYTIERSSRTWRLAEHAKTVEELEKRLRGIVKRVEQEEKNSKKREENPILGV